MYDTWSIKSQCHVIGEFYHMLIYNNTFTNFLKRCVKESSLIHCLENVVHLNIWRKYSCCLIVQNLACTCVVCLGLFVSVYRLLAVVAYALIFLLGEMLCLIVLCRIGYIPVLQYYWCVYLGKMKPIHFQNKPSWQRLSVLKQYSAHYFLSIGGVQVQDVRIKWNSFCKGKTNIKNYFVENSTVFFK